jgi:DNA-binding NtrC family response regulator
MSENHRILVVDDLPDWRSTLGGLLADEGYKVQVAGVPAQALGLLESYEFDLAVIDIRLDESDEDNAEGLSLAAEIKKCWPEVKVVIITGHGRPEFIKQAMQPDDHGNKLAADYIPKADTGNLVEVVKNILGQ